MSEKKPPDFWRVSDGEVYLMHFNQIKLVTCASPQNAQKFYNVSAAKDAAKRAGESYKVIEVRVRTYRAPKKPRGFDWAFRQIVIGKKVRRRAWTKYPHTKEVWFRGGNEKAPWITYAGSDGGGTAFMYGDRSNDLFANDWELAK